MEGKGGKVYMYTAAARVGDKSEPMIQVHY